MDTIAEAWRFSWQPESALVIVMVLGLMLVIGRIVPDTRHRLWNMLGFFTLTFAGQVAAGFCSVAGYAMAAVYAATHSFTLLFSVAGAVLLLAALIAAAGRPSIAVPRD